jgi:hypothetical protein
LSITHDADTEARQPRALSKTWQSLALRAAAAGCLGFVAGYGVALSRPAGTPATATPLALAAYAESEAKLARTAADMAIEIERLVDAERDYARFRGSRVEADALMRAGLALSDAMRSGGSYAAPLAALHGLEGGQAAIAPLSVALQRDADGVPDRASLAAQLDAIASSVLALGEEEPQRWTTRMVERFAVLIGSDNRAAIQERRAAVFAAANDAAARGALPEAIDALGLLDADAAAALAGWVEASQRRMALDIMADRTAAAVAAYAYR